MNKILAIASDRGRSGRRADRGRPAGAWSPLARSWWSGGSAAWSNRPGGPDCTGDCRWESTGSTAFGPTRCGKSRSAWPARLAPTSSRRRRGDDRRSQPAPISGDGPVPRRAARSILFCAIDRSSRCWRPRPRRVSRVPWRFAASTLFCDPIVRPSSAKSSATFRALVDRYQSGISILGVSLTDVRPPTEVEADFAAAQSAESERDRRVNEAKSYERDDHDRVAGRRRKQSSKWPMRPPSAQSSWLRPKLSDSLPCWRRLERSRSLTMHRLYIETMQALLDGVKRKLVLPPGGDIDLTVLGAKEELPARGQKPSPPSVPPMRRPRYRPVEATHSARISPDALCCSRRSSSHHGPRLRNFGNGNDSAKDTSSSSLRSPRRTADSSKNGEPSLSGQDLAPVYALRVRRATARVAR